MCYTYHWLKDKSISNTIKEKDNVISLPEKFDTEFNALFIRVETHHATVTGGFQAYIERLFVIGNLQERLPQFPYTNMLTLLTLVHVHLDDLQYPPSVVQLVLYAVTCTSMLVVNAPKTALHIEQCTSLHYTINFNSTLTLLCIEQSPNTDITLDKIPSTVSIVTLMYSPEYLQANVKPWPEYSLKYPYKRLILTTNLIYDQNDDPMLNPFRPRTFFCQEAVDRFIMTKIVCNMHVDMFTRYTTPLLIDAVNLINDYTTTHSIESRIPLSNNLRRINVAVLTRYKKYPRDLLRYLLKFF